MKNERIRLTEKEKQLLRESTIVEVERPFGSLRRSPSKKHPLYFLWAEQNGKA